jgi:hypothetical protein
LTPVLKKRTYAPLQGRKANKRTVRKPRYKIQTSIQSSEGPLEETIKEQETIEFEHTEEEFLDPLNTSVPRNSLLNSTTNDHEMPTMTTALYHDEYKDSGPETRPQNDLRIRLEPDCSTSWEVVESCIRLLVIVTG